MWTPASATAYNAYGDGHAWKFSQLQDDGRLRRRCRSTASGCARRTCTTGRCRRSPICSRTPSARPKVFWRGYDVYDPVRVGFVSSGPEAERVGTLFDTSLPGNGNDGHLYGTDLPAGRQGARSSNT